MPEGSLVSVCLRGFMVRGHRIVCFGWVFV